MGWKFAFLLIALFAVASSPRAAQNDIVGVASVIDGDTIEIRGTRIRLFGIDAPEGRQECRRRDGRAWRCGQQAALALQDHIGRRPLICTERDVDQYGRIVAQCQVNGEDINAWLVAQGWAAAYTAYSRDYAAQERAARAAGFGIWSGEFVMPWDWRRGAR
jgi:endonuclease YncB( thermonuclease family)